MKKWESIIKDKLERTDASLPESLFTEFLTRLDATPSSVAGSSVTSGPAGHPAAKRRPLLRVLVPAAAAGLAAFLFLHKPSVSVDDIQVAQQPPAPVAAIADTVNTKDPLQPDILVSRTVASTSTKHSPVRVPEPATTDNIDSSEETAETSPAEEVSIPETAVASESEFQEAKITYKPSVSVPLPSYNESIEVKPVGLKVAPAAGIVTGGGLLAAVLTPLIGSDAPTAITPAIPGDYGSLDDYFKDRATGEHTHHLPLVRGGLSVGIPIARRLKITTGLEYSRYRSSFDWYFAPSSKQSAQNGEWPSYGEKEQVVQYLGMPLRLDWSLAKDRMLDVYVGGGIAADYCIGATLTDKRPGKQRKVENLERDSFSFYFIGAGGVQVNVNERVGFYFEPELTWTGAKPKESSAQQTIPSGFYGYDGGDTGTGTTEDIGLETYRTEHPFMFNISTGLRFNFGK